MATSDDKDEDETLLGPSSDDESPDQFVGRDESQMGDFVMNFLKKVAESEPGPPPTTTTTATSDEDDGSIMDRSTATHLIAIPLDTNYELLLELESVQRAILYHCPMLVDACLTGARTRLDLLHVTVSNTSTTAATTWLQTQLEELIAEYLLIQTTDDDDEEEEKQPFTMTFQNLEIDGKNNNILHTIGKEDDEKTQQLVEMVHALEDRIRTQQPTWQTALPLDPHQQHDKKNGSSTQQRRQSFRPRVPFMKMPAAYDDKLDALRGKEDITMKEIEFLLPDNGGNGISPIFWCKWMKDVFGTQVRLRDIGIYLRQDDAAMNGGGGIGMGAFAAQLGLQSADEDPFYLPYETVPLPDGDETMMKQERHFEEYQFQRLQEQQEKLEQGNTTNAKSKMDDIGFDPKNIQQGDDSSKKAGRGGDEEPDFLMSKTRNRLEQLYSTSPTAEDAMVFDEDGAVVENQQADSTASSSTEAMENDDDDEDDVLDLSPNQDIPQKDDYMDDWMKARIRKVVDNAELIKNQTPKKKNKPAIEDNPIFQAYKNREKDRVVKPKKRKERELPDYPDRQHFIGIWKVVSSPTGFPTEDSTETSSENLILRADGTIAGGPILDQATRQKASGGTWSVTEEKDGEVYLKIRLVIPPKKERIIEMKGVMTRTDLNNIPMASRAFGVPDLEERAKNAGKSSGEITLSCDGTVIVEDEITKKNREEVGTFSLMKLSGPLRQGEYSIIIPKPLDTSKQE